MSEFFVFVNERPVKVVSGATVLDSVMALDPALGTQLAAGDAQATDARGIAVPSDAPVRPGGIVRALARRRADADA